MFSFGLINRRMLNPRDERGNVLIYLATAIIPFVAILGLVIDYGGAVWCRTNMQKAVDAAALAGATCLPDYTAVHKASEIAEANYSNYDDYSVDMEWEKLTVTMKRAVPTHFMRIFGQNWIPVEVRATAQQPEAIGTIRGKMMPFCLINPDTNWDKSDNLVPENWGKRYILCYGEDNIIIQDWYNGDTPWYLDETVWDVNKNNSMGWRGALALGDNDWDPYTLGGTDAFKEYFVNGYPGDVSIDMTVTVELGNIAGPIWDSRVKRLAGEEDFDFSDFDPNIHYDMNRVVWVPIVSLLTQGSTTDRYTAEDFQNGLNWEHKGIIIDGFAPFYLLTEQEMGDVDNDGGSKDKDWVVGIYIPGTKAPLHSEGGGTTSFGGKTQARLVD